MPSIVTIDAYLFYLAIGLIVAYFTHLLFKERAKKASFEIAANEFRNAFNQALVEIQGKSPGMLNLGISLDNDVTKTLLVSYHNFRPHLCWAYRKQYDQAWNEYCMRGIFYREEDIKRLLEFTEYSLLRHIRFIFKRSPKPQTPLSQELIDKINNFHNNN